MTNDASTSANIANLSTADPQLTVERHPEFCFDNTLVAIRIENTLFNIHKYQLLKSETFSDMFKLPRAKDGEPEEGSSLEHPIIMEGVAASDFVALLKVLYASHFSAHQPEPEASLIIPVFRLANLWNFSDLRAFLLPLAEKHLGDIDKIVFAREFDIKDWLAPAHIRLCQHQEKLTSEEAQKLGVESVLLIARLGRQNSQVSGYTEGQWYCDSCLGFTRRSDSADCAGCQGSSGRFGRNIYNGPGSHMQNGTSSLEREVKGWVQAGCVFKSS